MTGDFSPIDLPARLRASIGWRNCENLARVARRPFAHIQPGAYIRNVVRGMVCGWTDVELDDLWVVLIEQAAKGPRPP